MAKTTTTQIYNFFGREALNGGLNVSDNPLIVGPTEMTVAQNITIAKSLSRKKRPGQELYHTGGFASTASYPTSAAGNPIRGIIQYYRFASSTGAVQEDVFLHQNAKVWQIPDRTSAAIDRTGSLTLDTSAIISYQVFQGILYFCSTATSDGFNKWNGLPTAPGNATSAVGPADGDGKYLGVYQGALVMAGVPDFPFRLYLSDFLDGENWSSGNATSFDIDYDGDPEGITAIFPQFEGRLFFATRRTIYELTGSTTADFNIRRVTKGIGCVGHNTVVATPNDLVFCSDRGIHSIRKLLTSDQTEVQFLSRNIQTLWTNLLSSNILKQSSAVWEETQNLYILSVPSSGQSLNDTILSYNMTFGHWVIWEDVDARSLTNVLLSNKQYVLAGREDGKIALLDESNSDDFGTGFTARFKTGKFFPDGDITTEKQFKSITVLVSCQNPSNISVNWTLDSVDGQQKTGGKSISVGTGNDLLGSTFVLGTSRLGQGIFVPVKLSIEEHGYNIQFEIVAGGDSDIEFYGYQVEVEGAAPYYN